MCFRISSRDMVERSLILDRSGFKMRPVDGDGLATGGRALACGASFGYAGSCVTEGIEDGPCLAEFQAYRMDTQSSGTGGGEGNILNAQQG